MRNFIERRFNFVYITTNNVNGKQYVGNHATDNLNDRYLGSGRLFRKKVKQYGRENFSRKILECFSTEKEAYNAQERYIKLYNTHVTHGGYNKDWKGGWAGGRKDIGWHHTEEAREKIRAKRKLQVSPMKGKPSKNKGKPMSEEQKLKIGKANKGKVSNNKGKPMSEEQKLKISKSNKKSMTIERRQRITESLKKYHANKNNERRREEVHEVHGRKEA